MRVPVYLRALVALAATVGFLSMGRSASAQFDLKSFSCSAPGSCANTASCRGTDADRDGCKVICYIVHPDEWGNEQWDVNGSATCRAAGFGDDGDCWAPDFCEAW